MMESPPPSSDFDDDAFDPATPFRGIVVCCTSIPANERTDLAAKVLELGGTHKYDLTPDVTHLIVGEHNTQKYKHVAKSRPDIRPMAKGWVDAVRQLWIQDDPIDIPAIEKKWTLKSFETGGGALTTCGEIGETTKLLCCLSGFEDYEERCQIVEKIKANGGRYTGSLDRSVTHLIVYEPAGKKYIAAKRWGIHIVALKWVLESIERGMVLDEAFYDPLLPQEEIGKGAWTRRGLLPKARTKRPRDPTTSSHNSRRKLRKAASLKLNSQRENMWGEILSQQPSADLTISSRTEEPTQPLPDNSTLRPPIDNSSHSLSDSRASELSFFAPCQFSIINFPADHVAVLTEHITSRGGHITGNLSTETSQHTAAQRFVVVPQLSKPHTHPSVSDSVEIVTQFFIERCIHARRLLRPQEHVFGRPYPVFPINDFQNLTISTSGFVDLDLNHVERTVVQLGARYEERFNSQCTLLICASVSVRKAKLDLAAIWDIPVVKAEWLWQCISQGKKLPIQDFTFPELEARRANEKVKHSAPLSKHGLIASMRQDTDTTRQPGHRAQSTLISSPGPDVTANGTPLLVATEPCAHRQESNRATNFDTTQPHQTGAEIPVQLDPSQSGLSKGSLALAEKSGSELNKGFIKPQLHPEGHKPLRRVRSEVCDSDAGDGGDSPFVTDDDDAANLADAAEAKKSQLEWENENAVAERRALSHKLTTLLEGTSTRTGSDRVENQTSNMAICEVPAALPPPRRKRDIMGRAISNVSTASTESQDSGVGGRALSRTASAVIHRDDSPYEEEPETKAPTATQLQYDDPEATMSKARLMSKMLGRGSLGAGGSQKDAATDRVSMGSVSLHQDGLGNVVTAGRSLRRRQI